MPDERIIGTWRLRSTKAVDDAGKALPPPYGPTPNGVACFERDGRMFCVLCDGRAELPSSDARQFMSYAGNYAFDGAKLATRVDASSDESRIGGVQVRNVRFDRIGMVMSPTPRLVGNVMQHQEFFWERIG